MQQRHDSAYREQHPPPGQFVTVHQSRGQEPLPPLPQFQHRIHYRLHGEGDVTFILEAGLGDYSGSWQPLEEGLAKLGRVFVYDRAGLGWSEPCRLSPGPARSGNELDAILQAANVPPPYILVGHSLGALSHYVYFGDSRGRVAGLLLIDPSHPHQFKRLPPPPRPV
jgi:pimeloyl-ACP methyl ester carboxylesterase